MARLAAGGRAGAKALMCLGEAAYNHGQRAQALERYGQATPRGRALATQRGAAEAALAQGRHLLGPQRVRARER